jgi:hypothetical protein
VDWQHYRARLATLSRRRAADDPELLAARRNMRAELFAEHLSRLIGDAPELTDEQRGRIAAILRGSGLSI